MEEIGALFGDEVVVHLTADGHGIVEDKLEYAPVSTHVENLHRDTKNAQDSGTRDKAGHLGVESMDA